MKSSPGLWKWLDEFKKKKERRNYYPMKGLQNGNCSTKHLTWPWFDSSETLSSNQDDIQVMCKPQLWIILDGIRSRVSKWPSQYLPKPSAVVVEGLTRVLKHKLSWNLQCASVEIYNQLYVNYTPKQAKKAVNKLKGIWFQLVVNATQHDGPQRAGAYIRQSTILYIVSLLIKMMKCSKDKQ